MKTPRDADCLVRLIDEDNAFSLGTVYIFLDGPDGHITVRREAFDSLVDWYIGTPAIRAYVKRSEARRALANSGACACETCITNALRASKPAP